MDCAAEQQDEVLALESIYSDAFKVVSPSGVTPRVIEVEITPEVLAVTEDTPTIPILGIFDDPDAPRSSSSAVETGQGVPVPCASVRHLPPLTLHVILPENYPENSPPAFSLTAAWLSARDLSRLCVRLDEIWEEQGGSGPVVFSWTSFLTTELFSFLGLEPKEGVVVGGAKWRGSTIRRSARGELDERETGEAESRGFLGDSKERDENGERGGRKKEEFDPRAFVDCPNLSRGEGGDDSSADSSCGREGEGGLWGDEVRMLVGELVRFSRSKEAEEFVAALHICSICFEERPGGECEKLRCSHVFCRECLTNLCTLHVTEGTLEALRCPAEKCRQELSTETLRSLLSSEAVERFERLSLQRALDGMGDVVYCPRCETNGAQHPVLENPEDHMAECDTCGFVFCSLCRDVFHPEKGCLSPEERLEVLERRQKGMRASGEEYVRARMNLANEKLNLEWLQSESKSCPNCKMAIQKTEGCNKMKCSTCQTSFCWLCMVEIWGYDHFGHGRCAMFDEEEIERWNRRMMNPRQRHQLLQDPEHGGGEAFFNDPGGAPRVQERFHFFVTFKHCPQCQRRVAKDGMNNHMRCTTCGCSFCYVCQTRFTKKGQAGAHFAARQCPQHSAD